MSANNDQDNNQYPNPYVGIPRAAGDVFETDSNYFRFIPQVFGNDELPYHVEDYIASPYFDAHRFAVLAYIRRHYEGYDDRQRALKHRGDVVHEDLAVLEDEPVWSDMPYARTASECEYQRQLYTLFERLMADFHAGRDLIPSEMTLLALSVLPHPVDRFYLLNRSSDAIRKDVAFETRMRRSNRMFVGYHNVEFHRLARNERSRLYLSCNLSYYHDVPSALQVPTPPCVAYVSGLIAGERNPQLEGRLWQVVAAEWAELVFHRVMVVAKYGADSSSGIKDRRLSSELTAAAPKGRILPIPRQVVETWFGMGFANLAHGTEFSESDVRSVVKFAVLTDWGRTPGFIFYDFSSRSFHPMWYEARYGQTPEDNLGQWPQVDEEPLWYRRGRKRVVPRFVRGATPFSTSVEFNAPAAIGEPEVEEPEDTTPRVAGQIAEIAATAGADSEQAAEEVVITEGRTPDTAEAENETGSPDEIAPNPPAGATQDGAPDGEEAERETVEPVRTEDTTEVEVTTPVADPRKRLFSAMKAGVAEVVQLGTRRLADASPPHNSNTGEPSSSQGKFRVIGNRFRTAMDAVREKILTKSTGVGGGETANVTNAENAVAVETQTPSVPDENPLEVITLSDSPPSSGSNQPPRKLRRTASAPVKGRVDPVASQLPDVSTYLDTQLSVDQYAPDLGVFSDETLAVNGREEDFSVGEESATILAPPFPIVGGQRELNTEVSPEVRAAPSRALGRVTGDNRMYSNEEAMRMIPVLCQRLVMARTALDVGREQQLRLIRFQERVADLASPASRQAKRSLHDARAFLMPQVRNPGGSVGTTWTPSDREITIVARPQEPIAGQPVELTPEEWEALDAEEATDANAGPSEE